MLFRELAVPLFVLYYIYILKFIKLGNVWILIKSFPKINVLIQVIVFISSDEIDANQPPQPCGAMSGCGGNMLAAWAVGINGLCMNEDVGIRIGKYGAKAASLRVWKLHYLIDLTLFYFNSN